ncbi:unnamed protein product [Spirodela intermedia]|uniref:CMP/dCMP-type deaminase domain-containing protein n=1 Tax=Spirodela intermedia TaxID=51605 RepID=A0A7I8JAW3_SPIIN|nr:unnamed protein product [Spirodela intermedia]CAA6666583.1 unnamed protein product [Spirodela intermedia]
MRDREGWEVVGEGFHPKAGQPHAEVFALRDAGELAENATAYVSLEPCNHYGRTPPCTEALIKAKVKRVVVGMVDPNPIVASRGVERLRESGIEVAAYIHRMLSGRPFLTLRYSLSINGGGILDHTGRGAKESGGYYSQLLRDYDGVVVSGSSFDEKSTLPASQEVGANQPAIIIIAAKGGPPLRLRLRLSQPSDETDRNLSQLGIEKVVLDELRLTPVVEYCSRQGMCSLLVDFSGDSAGFVEMLGEAGEVGLVQKVVVELCSAWEGQHMAAVAAPLGVVGRPFQFRHLQSWVSKDSVVVEGYVA